MVRHSIGRSAGGGAAVLFVASLSFALPSSSHAENFLSRLFGTFGAWPPPVQIRPPLPNVHVPPQDILRRRVAQAVVHADEQAYCVRSCDGRYFPVQGPDSESRARSCKSFCPASKTILVYGSDIDNATTESGKPYSELPHAFRYRKEIVAGCTCNGKDKVGLAPVNIASDPTLRKGDIVAGAGGLLVANHSAGDRRGVAVNFTPLPNSKRARFHHIPVVARQ